MDRLSRALDKMAFTRTTEEKVAGGTEADGTESDDTIADIDMFTYNPVG